MATHSSNQALRQAMDVYIHTLEGTSKLGLTDRELRIEFLKAVFCERVIESGMSDNEVTLFKRWIECTDLFRKA